MANGIDIDVGQSLLVGPQGPQGEIGPRGYGIKTIAKTGTDGLVDTYTVTFDDDRTATFEVTNGRAISSIDLTSTVENVDTYTITYNDGTTSTFTVTNSNVSREEFEKALELTNSEMDTAEAEGEKVKLTGVATTNLDITVQGNTYQKTTATGKNLLDPNSGVSHLGITSTTNEDGSISYSGIATSSYAYISHRNNVNIPIGSYVFSIDKPIEYGVRLQLVYEDDTTSSALTINPGRTFVSTTTNQNVKQIVVYLVFLTADTEYNDTLYLQLEQGEEPTEYEEYSGGAPSPNPDYPQEIQVVTGDNEVQIQGKNLLNPTLTSGTVNGIHWELNDDKSITLNGTATAITWIQLEQGFAWEEGNYTMFINDIAIPGLAFYSDVGNTTTIGNISISEPITKKTYLRIQTNSTYNNVTVYPMIVKGSYTLATIGKYEPYIGANYPLSLGTIELAKIGDYKDYVYKSGTDWFIHRAIGKVVLDGSENWSKAPATTGFLINNFPSNRNNNVYEGYSNFFTCVNTSATWQGLGKFGWSTSNTFWLQHTTITEVSQLRDWIQENAPTVYYVLATPTEEQITDTTLIQQLEALSQATAKGNNFIVTTETENLKPILKVQYKESTRYKADDLENRVEKLEEQIKHAGHVYGVRRKRENNSSSEWERTDDAIGLVANATHDGTEVQNDFDNLSPWKDIISFNLDLETGHKKAYYGDPDFAFDGSNGDVYTHIPDIYYRVWHDDEYDYVQIADFAESEFEKCDKFDIQRYTTGRVDGVLHSYSGIATENSRSLTSYRNLVREIGEDYCLLDWRYFIIQLLYLVEYANYNSQTKLGNGYSTMRYNKNDVSLLAETNTHRFVVNTNAGDAFTVGQIISIGTAIERNDIANSRKITAITDYNEDGITGKSITFDGSAITTTITNVIWSSPQNSGDCDSLGMKSGCHTNDGKHNVIYRGIEGIFGNVFQWIDGINISEYQAYICYNPNEYETGKIDSPYESLTYVNTTTNGYIQNLGFDINNPLIRFPISAAGASGTYVTDYYYGNTGLRSVAIGGILNASSFNGMWYFRMNLAAYSSSWFNGARVIKYK